MPKRLSILLAALLTAALPLAAGQRLTLQNITDDTFRAETMGAITPLSDGSSYAMLTTDGRQVVTYSFKTGRQTGTLFDVATARGAQLQRIDGYVLSPTGDRMLIQTATERIYRHSFTATYYIYTIATGRMEPLSQGGPQQAPVWSPDGNQVAFVRDGNIHLVKLLYNNAESEVTRDGSRGSVLNGVPDWVYEEEFSTSCSMVFTADSRQLVWIRYDESQVPEYQLPHFAVPTATGSDTPATTILPPRADGGSATLFSYKYPVAGEPNATVQLMSYDIKSHQTRTLQLPLDADGYIPRLKATADPTKVAVLTLNRHQDCLKVFMANPLTTVCQLVVEDKVARYINENVLDHTRLTPQHIVMTSERDGYNHIYIYTLNGQLQRTVGDVTGQGGTGHTIVTDVYGLDETTGDVYFAALADGPTDQRVYVQHRNGRTDCLTPEAGWSQATFSADYKSFICTWSDLNTPPRTTLRQVTGATAKTTATLIDNQALAQRYASFDMGRKELFTLQTSEGVTLYGWMVKPADFDPSRRYPVVMYQYGGPGSQQVRNTWNIGMTGRGAALEQYLAEQGCIAVCVDNRGTGGRGADFEKQTYLRLGELEARDQVETALWLGRQSYVDAQHIAIWGWSYGGWNTLMAMSEGRPVFCCGVAIAPPTCWRFYDTIYTERFMRTPNENASGYDEVNPIVRAPQLSGRLLLVHGLADDNVHYQNTATYVDALILADKDFRQLVYTNRNHSIYGRNTRNHLYRQCIDFMTENLR